jgi:hypothetical protein
MKQDDKNQPTENISNKDQQAVDKSPGEERGKGEKVSNKDLKGKKVDADLSQQKDRPGNSRL